MSYEGYREFRCKCGETDAADVYADQPVTCRLCGSPFFEIRSIDQTNGTDVLPWREVEFRTRFRDYVARGVYPDAEWHGPT